MPVLPLGAFERGMQATRRGFDRAGVAASLGQSPLARRMLGFGGGQGLGAPQGRESFRPAFAGGSRQRAFAAPWGQTAEGRSDFRGLGGFDAFAGVSWDASGRRIKAGDVGGASPGGYGGPTGDAAIDAAAQRNGVPPAVLRALVNRESSGDWAGNNYVHHLRGERMLPYVGIFESTANSWGIPFESLIGNQGAQLDAMARIIGGIKQQRGFSDWGQAAAYYFAGPNAFNPGWTDENGMSVADYQASFNADVARFSYGGTAGVSPGVGTGAPAGGPGAGAGYGGGGWSSSLWGGANAPVTYEFNAPSVNGSMYTYGAAHGTDGWSHPGVDVGVPRGTTLFTPKSGTVSCVGSADAGLGGTGGGSCGYFSDEGGGVGNVTVRFDDGTYLIFGHSQAALVQPGQRVSAGQAVALSGGLRGDHVHFEYRVPGTCPSGYCVADPRQMGGWSGAGYAGAPTGQTGGGTNVGGVQASNGAYYSPNYVIPTRMPR